MNKKIEQQVLKEIKPDKLTVSQEGKITIYPKKGKGKVGLFLDNQSGYLIYSKVDLKKAITRTQELDKAEFRKMIEELIKVRKKSCQWRVSDYQEVFSTNDLNSILSKLDKK